jgi:hypothetical protein
MVGQPAEGLNRLAEAARLVETYTGALGRGRNPSLRRTLLQCMHKHPGAEG